MIHLINSFKNSTGTISQNIWSTSFLNDLMEPLTAKHPFMIRAHMRARLLVMMVAAGLLMASHSFSATLLDKIDVVTSRYGTELKLHAAEPVQHKVLKATDSEMVVRFKGVVPTHHIKTNFAKAEDITHVIFQPEGGDTIKMMLRGKALGQPVIQTIYPTVQSQNSVNRYQQQLASSVKAKEDKPLLEPASKAIPEPVFTESVALPEVALKQPLPETSPEMLPEVALPQVENELPKPSPASETFDKESSGLDAELFGQSSIEEDAFMPTAVESSSMMSLVMSEVNQLLGSIDFSSALMTGGVLLILLAGLGFFIKHKWEMIQELAGGGMARTISPLSQSRSSRPSKSSIRELMRQQRNSERDIVDEDDNFSPQRHPKKANQWASRPNTRVNQPVNRSASRVRSASRPASNGGALKSSTGARQAVNSYQRQASAAKKVASNANSNASATRARSNMKNAGPAGNSNEPLPNNPRITNFLKDVAQYMEKNGETGKARRIQRNIPKD